MKYRNLDEARTAITDIDARMAALFEERIGVSREIAKIKQETNVPVADFKREEIVEADFVRNVSEDYKDKAKTLSRTLIALSKIIQRVELYGKEDEEVFPQSAPPPAGKITVCYQGVRGAWGEAACKKIFGDIDRTPKEYFEDVFACVSSGEIGYGVLPIENSETGAIGEVYDLLKKYGCYIVKQTSIPINHCLMAKNGVAIEDIREVYSHPEGFKQCARFIKSHNFDRIAAPNTAVAAELVSKSDSTRIAAIASPNSAALYGLTILDDNIVTKKDNRTRFIVIAKEPHYDESSDNITISFKTAHYSGALCDVLFQFMSGGINLSRIESRPSGNGEYMFFVDLKGNIADKNVVQTLGCARASSIYLEVLGCYDEVE